MKVKTNPQLNQPQPQNTQGMENFLTQSTSPKEEKMKVQQTNPKPSNPQPSPSNPQMPQFEEMIKEIEQKLLKNVKHRELELTAFNNLMYTKRLMFKVLFIREKIYSLVSDPQTNRVTIVSITPPRWGGSSLRYMLANCVDDFCVVLERNTKKGTILTYQQLGKTNSQEQDVDINDIFD